MGSSHVWGFPGSSDGKEPAYNAGDRVQSLGWEDALEKGMATRSSFCAQRILRTEEPGGATVHGVPERNLTPLSN